MLSNVSVGCECAAHDELPPLGDGDNNWFNSNYVDIDSNGITFMSSSDKLDLSDCSQITWAGLYWHGGLNFSDPELTNNYVQRNQVKLSVDGGSYINLNADELFDNSIGKISYFAFKDITSILQENTINSRYTIANIVTETGINSFGGWTIVVVYKNELESYRNLTVFNGLANVTNGIAGTVNIPLSGFLTPPLGTVSFELGVVAHDGDRSQSGDQLEFNGNGTFINISDSIHLNNNVFNSTISNGGILTPYRDPNFNNTLGYDANIYIPDNSTNNYLGNSVTSSTIRVSTTSETVLTSVISSSIDIYEPELHTKASFEDLNGGTILPGDTIEFTIVCMNKGTDNSINTTLFDTLDTRLNYISESIKISYGPNSGNKTDIIDSDQAEFELLNNILKIRIGDGANSSIGGEISNSPNGNDSTIVKFKVQLSNDCIVWQCGESLINKSYLIGYGESSTNLNSNYGLSDNIDLNGCPIEEIMTINVDVNLCSELNIEYTDSLCVGDSLVLNFNDSQNAEYNWTGPNGFSSNISNPSIPNVQLIDSGFYSLQVIYNGDNCFSDSNIFIFISDNPNIQLNYLLNPTCFNSNNGEINVSGVGNGDYSYLWSNNDLDSIVENLFAGTYILNIIDKFGCKSADTFNITEPQEILITANSIVPSCQGGTQGLIDINVLGGTPNYNYLWNNSITTEDLINLYDGLYTVIVTDSNGCKDTLSIQLNDPDAPFLSEIHQNVKCYGDSTGSIDLTVNSGIGSYTYNWSNGFSNEDIFNLTSGNYFVNVLDQNNCGAFISVFINQPDTSIYFSNVNHSNAICYKDSNAFIDLSVNGGTSPYSYLWNNGAITEDIINLNAGEYFISIIDGNDCELINFFTISEPDSLISNVIKKDVECLGDNSGSIEVSTIGGTAPYSYYWNTGAESQNLIDLTVGEYILTTKDSNNCLHTLSINIVSLLNNSECVKLAMPNVFTPNDDLNNDVFTPIEIKNIQ